MTLQSFTLRDVIERNALQRGAQLAFAFREERVTHGQYAERTRRLAAGLAGAGVGPDDRIAVLASNCLEYVDLLGAAARLGATLVPISWRLKQEEVDHILRDAAPKVLIVEDTHAALMPGEIARDVRRYALGAGGSFGEPMARLYVDRDPPRVDVGEDAGCVIVHTAAAGGKARGVVVTHRGLMAWSLQSQLAWRLTPADVHVCALPLFHLAGLDYLIGTQHAGGATIVLTRFDAEAVVAHIDRDGGSMMGAYPPMLTAILDAAAAAGSKLPSLRVVTGIESPEVIARLHASTKASWWSLYGQTETSGPISLSPHSERPGANGRPTALSTVGIVDEQDRPLPPGRTGEIVARGPMVFPGYWRRPEDNAFTFRNGWHHTGDLGHLDADGYLWFEGPSPAKELIKPGGENVYPAEVESAILLHPAVAEAVVIGVPDAEWGQAIKAICVLKAGQTLGPGELVEFVGARIARYKKPKQVSFVEALPRTAGGLIDREAVKARHGRG